MPYQDLKDPLPSGIRRVTADRFEDLPDEAAASWDSLAGQGDFFLTGEWLRFTERTGAGNHYLTYSLEGRLIAATVVNLVSDQAPGHVRVDAALQRAAVRADFPDTVMPSLHLGGRNVRASRLLLADGLSPQLAHACAQDLVGWAREEATARGAQSLSALYTVPGDGLHRAIEAAGWHRFASLPTAVMRIDFDDFDGYLARFRSKKRVMIKRERARVRELGLFCVVEPLEPTLIDECAPLIRANGVKHGTTGIRTGAVAAWLTSLSESLPGRFEAICARDQTGRLLGVVTFLSWRNDLYLDQAGFDYEARGSAPLYFELVVYRTIDEALLRGAEQIDFAVGLADVKASRGCSLAPRDGYVEIVPENLQGRVPSGEHRS